MTQQGATESLELRSDDSQSNGDGKLALASYQKPGNPACFTNCLPARTSRFRVAASILPERL